MHTIGTIEMLLSTRLSHLLCLHNLFKTYNHCLYVPEVLFFITDLNGCIFIRSSSFCCRCYFLFSSFISFELIRFPLIRLSLQSPCKTIIQHYSTHTMNKMFDIWIFIDAHFIWIASDVGWSLLVWWYGKWHIGFLESAEVPVNRWARKNDEERLEVAYHCEWVQRAYSEFWKFVTHQMHTR